MNEKVLNENEIKYTILYCVCENFFLFHYGSKTSTSLIHFSCSNRGFPETQQTAISQGMRQVQPRFIVTRRLRMQFSPVH